MFECTCIPRRMRTGSTVCDGGSVVPPCWDGWWVVVAVADNVCSGGTLCDRGASGPAWWCAFKLRDYNVVCLCGNLPSLQYSGMPRRILLDYLS